jgi:hypothetical protein
MDHGAYPFIVISGSSDQDRTAVISPYPFDPGFLSKEPLSFVIINPPSNVGRSGSGESFKLAPGFLFIHRPSPEFQENQINEFRI